MRLVHRYKVFPELSGGIQFFGVRRTRVGFYYYDTDVLHYFRTEEEAYRFILECRRKDRETGNVY